MQPSARRHLLPHGIALSLALCGQAAARAAPIPPVFEDAAQATGLTFRHDPGTSDERYFPEIVGAGVALFDYDADGDLDVYLVQSGRVVADHGQPGDRLFRNDLVAGDPTSLAFTDVTEAVGLDARGYGMGVAVLDYDGDGRRDLYLTNWGANQLWRNRGQGFVEVTTEAGVDDRRWSVPAAVLDFDRDGRPDLYVGNYADFRVANHKRCFSPNGIEDYCAPVSYNPEPDRLFRNRGDGGFDDVTLAAGLSTAFGYALGAFAGDFDGDGWLDLYVANDGVANQLWLNRGDGTFRDDALLAGAAVNAMGEPEASMGIDAADVDDDGDLDVFLAHLTKETNTLYLNGGVAGFEDRTASAGLGETSWASTGFGAAWIDYDNDADLDLIVVNGAVAVVRELAEARDPYPFHQRDQIFENRGNLRFVDISESAGEPFRASRVSRGAAIGDLDNDGRVDVVISNNAGPATLLRNRTSGGGWLGLVLEDTRSWGDPVGATATLEPVDTEAPRSRVVATSSSYVSARDPRIVFGLGDRSQERRSIVVRWPDGARERFAGIAIGRYTTLTRGSGVAESSP